MGFLDKNWRALLFAAILLSGLALRGNLWLLPMNDEAFYASIAVENHLGRLDPNPEHPPLAKWLLGLPSLALPYNRTEFLKLGTEYAVAPPAPFVEKFSEEFLPPMRGVSLALSLLLALLAFFFARRWLGEEAGLLAFFLSLFSPNLSLYSNAVMLDMAFLLFFSAALWFYVFEYCAKRSLRRAAVLGVLVFMAMGTKFYGFYALGLIGMLEAGRIWKQHKANWRLYAALAAASAAFIAFSYPIDKIQYAISHYFKGAMQLNLNLLAQTLARLEPVMVFLVALAAYSLWKGVREERAQQLALISLLLLVSAALNPFTMFRYSLAAWPFLIMLSAWAFSRATGWQKKAALALSALLVVEAAAYYPYYDNYANPAGVVLRVQGVERAPALGAHAFLKNAGGTTVTDDPYNLPFSFDYDAQFIWHFAYEKGAMPRADTRFFAEALCFDEALMEEYLRDAGYSHLVRRVDGLAEPPNCPALYAVSSKVSREYADEYFEVYRLK